METADFRRRALVLVAGALIAAFAAAVPYATYKYFKARHNAAVAVLEEEL